MSSASHKEMIAVWFSCGAASAVAAKITLARYKDHATVRVVNTPVKQEHPDNFRFLQDVQEWLGVEIEYAFNPKYLSCSCVDVWNDAQYMSGVGGAPCTRELKKKSRELWEDAFRPDYHVLGFTADEKKRHDRFYRFERANILPVLNRCWHYKSGMLQDTFRCSHRIARNVSPRIP